MSTSLGLRALLVVFAVAMGTGGATSTPADELEATAYLGVRLSEETERAEGGALVTHVVPDSPADRAGLKDGDIVVSFDGKPIRGPLGLTERIQEHEPGERVALAVVRGGDKKTLEVELGERKEQLGLFVAPSEEWKEKTEDVRQRMEELGQRLGEPHFYALWGKPKLGVQLVDVTPELRSHLGGPAEAGVLVSKVLKGTPAERAGIAVGDLVVAVEGRQVATSGDLVEALSDKSGKTFTIELVRARAKITIEVTIPAPAADRPTGPRA